MRMGLGFGFNAGPVRASASLRGGGAAAGEFVEALPVLIAICVGYSVVGAIVRMLLDPYFYLYMFVGAAPAVGLLLFHAVALDKAAKLTRWSRRDGIFTLLALPAAGYEVLFFVWAEDGFGWEISIGGKWMPQLAYLAVMLAYLTFLTFWISFTVRAIRRSLSPAEKRRRRQIDAVKRKQASEDRRLMRENQVIVKQHGIEHAAVLRLVLEEYRIMEDYKDLVVQHGLTDASQVRAYLRERGLEKSRIQQLEMKQAQLFKQADAEERRKARVIAVKMQQFGHVVQNCLNPEQGIEISEEQLRAAFRSIRSFLNRYQELSPIAVAKYEKVISELSATVEDKTGYQSL